MKTELFFLFAFGLFSLACNKNSNCVVSEKDNPTIVCTMDYAPVCGCDGKTYSNECMAKGAGVFDYTQGECKTHKFKK